MILIELGQDDFDRHGFAIIGRVVNAIAKVIQSDSGLNRFQAEREAWPHILTGVRLGALHPIDQGTRHKLSIDACGDGAVRFDELVEWGRKTELFDFKRVVPIEEKYIAQAAAACDTEQKQPKPKNVQSAEEIKRARRQRLENAILPTTGSGRAVQHRVWAAAQVPDWEFWRDMPEVELWQACALSLNLDPDPLTPSDDGMGMGGESYFKARSFPNDEAWEKFNKRLRLLEANMQRPTVRLADFVTWASSLSTPWDMPPELVALAQKPEALAGKPVPAPTTSAYMEGSDAEPEQLEAQKKGGRPREIGKKADVLRKLITAMTVGRELDTRDMPGSAANLLDACQRIEKAKNHNRAELFDTTEDTFKTWLTTAGYSFKNGRTPKIEEQYWTKLCVETMGKIPPEVFT